MTKSKILIRLTDTDLIIANMENTFKKIYNFGCLWCRLQ